MSPLNGKTFVLECSRDIRFKAKQELINYLREQNSHISYILTASTDYVLVSNDIDTYKTRRAKQLGIPLVNIEYIYECRNSSSEKEPVDIKRFIVTSAEDKDNFSKSGTIPVSGGGGGSSSSIVKPIKFDLSKIKIWNSDDVELPRFDELTHAEIGKWAIFKETNENSDVYFVLELQIIPAEHNNQTTHDYRLRFRYEKQTTTISKGKLSSIQYAFSDDINELHHLFASYYHRIGTMPRITRIRDLLPDKLGSKLLLRSLFLHRIDTQMLNDNVCQLIESLWLESIGDLNKILSVQPESIALKTITEAEAALLEIKSNSESSSEAETRFYSLIQHRSSFVVDLIKDRRALIDKIDLCQMLRDMLTVNELTNWNIKASIGAKYRALKCHVEAIESDTQEYRTINNMISSSTNQNEKVIVHQIYSVAKQTDVLNFRSALFNQKQLFHGSKYNNFLGILSRGLLMPKMVVNDLGITRTDIGCLGYGIYFSDSVSTSLKYTTASSTRSGRRLLCISQVALGDTAKFYSFSSNLTQAPENFHSTHGVKRTSDNNSKFIDDEYAIYNLDQQRLQYLVEVSWIPHDDIKQPLKLLPIIRDQFASQSMTSTNKEEIPSIIEDEVIQVAEQDYGLICPSSGELVPLKAFHIRAQLVDVTAEVVLYQVYHNSSSIPIEAKYVFPLDENCSVCGFEAHINNKIIKGVVKEKEQAKREYREAIEKGHGAYLMHQEQPEVFSVSVGNLPANCEVIIKITYVTELSIENDDIIFRLPAKVASWQAKQALEAKDQTIVPSINLEQDSSSMKSVEFSLKTSIRMPYEISKLFSPTHRLRRKITGCIAMIELADNILLEKDFILSITLKSVNLPRMLNETFVLSDENNNNQIVDENSQACMVTFYPKFEMTNKSNEYVEIVFIIDVSNSMDGNHVQQAKQLAHLFLTNMKIEDGNIYFNIVTFGSDNDECFPISSLNTKENIEKAKHFVLHSLDHRGNTDLFSVLRQYSLLPSPSKLGRQFILLSDGHINDLKSILTLLENQSSMRHDRLFTCSIGDISNKHNLKQLANGTNGGGLTTVFDSNYRSKWRTKVLHILEHIRQPCVTNISIEWHGTIDDQQERFTNQAPKIIRSLFSGMRLTVYRFIQNCHKATLTATINDQEFVTNVFSNKVTETKGRILHCLTTRAIIQDYENGLLHNDESENELIKKQYKQDLIELSMKYSVVSSFTSFVAIEERDGEALETGVRLLDVMLENDIDLLPYISWDGDRSQIEINKEKLLNAKRLFDSASISNKIDLTNEYENLCQNISYRSGGDAKYDLMLTIIDTYRLTFKQEEKAREIENKMQKDLLNEMNNATAEERTILEKRLEEINLRVEVENSANLEDQHPTTKRCRKFVFNDIDLEEEEEDDSTDNEGGGDISRIQRLMSSSSSDGELNYIIRTLYSKSRRSVSRDLMKLREFTMEAHEWNGNSEDMGFGDDDEVAQVRLQSLETNISVDPQYAMDKMSLPDDEEDEVDHYYAMGPESPKSNSVFEKPLVSSIKSEERFKHASFTSSSAKDQDKSSMIVIRKSVLQRREVLEDNLTSIEWMKDSRDGTSSLQEISPVHQQQQQIMSQSASSSYAPQLPQQQQQQQQQYTTVQSYSQELLRESHLSATEDENHFLNTEAATCADDSYEGSTFGYAPTPSPFSIPTTTNTSSFSSGFRGITSCTTAAPAPPPPPPSGSLFSFSSSSSSANSGNIKASNLFAVFGRPATFSYAAPPPPPPPLPPNSILFGTGVSSNINPFGMQPGSSNQSMFTAPPFQPSLTTTASTFSFGASGGSNTNAPPAMHSSPYIQPMSMAPTFQPPSSATAAAGFSFGGGGVSNINAPSMQSASYIQPMFMAPASQPPPPTGTGFSFGVRGGSDTNAPTKHSAPHIQPMFMAPTLQTPPSTTAATFSFGDSGGGNISAPTISFPYYTQQMPMPSAYPPPPPPPAYFPATQSPFGTSSLRPVQQSLSFDTVSASTHSNVPFSMTASQSISTIPMAPSSASTLSFFNNNSSSTPTSSIFSSSSMTANAPPFDHAVNTSATKFAFADNGIEAQLQNLHSTVERKENVSFDRDCRERSVESYDKSRSPASYLMKYMGIKKAPVFDQKTARVEKTTTLADDSSHPARYTDTRCDEQERTEIRAPKYESLINNLLSGKISSTNENSKKSRQSTLIHKGPLAELLLLDVTPLSLGVEDIHGHMHTIISRNRTIPTKTQFYPVFTNAYAYQTTATIRIFQGEHKLTKHNTFIGELILTGLTPNFASQILEISIQMDIDANGLLQVDAEESRSGVKASIRIDPNTYSMTCDNIERHMKYVESDSSFQAQCVSDRQANDPLYRLIGQTENSAINFTGESGISTDDFSAFGKLKNIVLTSTQISEIKRIQFSDGSFDLNKDLASLLSININYFDELKRYLSKQGFNSFALNIRNEILHLIATGIMIMELLFEVPVSERKGFLVPFNREQIQLIFHDHLPKLLLENADRAIDFYEQKRLRYGIYCEQLELKYSSWEKFIQFTIFGINQ